MSTVLLIGPFPPPVHGFSSMTLKLEEWLSGRGATSRADTQSSADGRLKKPLAQAGLALRAAGAIMAYRLKGGRRVSIGCNAGYGQLFTLLHILVARVFLSSTSLHHHSYNYIDSVSHIMRAICFFGGSNLTHVFLARSMRDAFQTTYGRASNYHIVSNAAFVPSTLPRLDVPGAELVMGLISNLDRQKGLYDFISAARQFRDLKLPVKMILAGPARDPEDANSIIEAEREGVLESRGPLYGEEKDRFFREIDIFLFPTRYRNEAQPTVIYEAFAAGVPVIAFNRGAIGEQVGNCFGVISHTEDFLDKLLSYSRQWLLMSSSDRFAWRERARERHALDSAAALASLELLFPTD